MVQDEMRIDINSDMDSSEDKFGNVNNDLTPSKEKLIKYMKAKSPPKSNADMLKALENVAASSKEESSQRNFSVHDKINLSHDDDGEGEDNEDPTDLTVEKCMTMLDCNGSTSTH